MNNRQTPLEKLISDKERIREQCKIQEQKLNEDFSYIQENAGTLLISGLSSLLFPGNKSTGKTNNEASATSTTTGQPTLPLNIGDYLAIAKSMLPLVWDLAQPFIMTWGINKAKRWATNLFFKKKK